MLPDHGTGSQLLERYGDLLTDHQREVLEEYYFEDLSMNEIADNYGVSKAAISDLIRRTCDTLEKYENSLHLVSVYNELETLSLKMNEKNVDKDLTDLLDKILRG